MSGSNAIAAAKRRRGGTEVNKPVVNQNRNQPQTQNNSNAPPSQIHPLQLVMINHERLNKLYNDFNQFPQALDGLGENFNALSSNCDFLHEKLEELEGKLSTFNLSNQDTSNKNVNIEFNNQLTTRIDSVEVRVNDLFKQVSSLQGYMLELTLSLNNLKENMRQTQTSVLSSQTSTSNLSVQSPVQSSTNIGPVALEQTKIDFVKEESDTLTKEDLQNINYII